MRTGAALAYSASAVTSQAHHPWWKRRGWRYHPFQYLDAARDPHLLEYLVVPGFRSSLVGGPTDLGGCSPRRGEDRLQALCGTAHVAAQWTRRTGTAHTIASSHLASRGRASRGSGPGLADFLAGYLPLSYVPMVYGSRFAHRLASLVASVSASHSGSANPCPVGRPRELA